MDDFQIRIFVLSVKEQVKQNNMPKFLEEKLKKEYPDNPHAVYGTLNKIGAVRGSKETKKGRSIEKALENKKKK